MLQRNNRNAQVEILLKAGYMSYIYSFIVEARLLLVRLVSSNSSTTMALEFVY
jgi:hypothetical protein